MSDTFVCGRCEKEFQKGWSDEEAKAEYKKNFPDTQGDAEDLVCDPCYKEILAWLEEGF